jgi:uncharacterized repeat protein (TIGR03843 family)
VSNSPDEAANTLGLLARGEITLEARIPWSSNATFLVQVAGPPGAKGGAEVPDGAEGPRDGDGHGDGGSVLAIYKPEQGERPLWDFPRGLWRREVAAYELARYLGWDIVPPTLGRLDGPLGEGSLQLFIEADTDEHYFSVLEEPAYHEQLRRVTLFDLVINNADRKGGHFLLGPGQHVWAIDHGVCFHEEPKLRTVAWDFIGQAMAPDLLADLAPTAAGELPPILAELLSPPELQALAKRATTVIRRRKFPRPVGDFPYPWPLI